VRTGAVVIAIGIVLADCAPHGTPDAELPCSCTDRTPARAPPEPPAEPPTAADRAPRPPEPELDAPAAATTSTTATATANTTANTATTPANTPATATKLRGIRSCYEAALRSDPSLAGRVVVRFEIAEDGTARNVRDGGSDASLPPTLLACIRRQFAGRRFPFPTNGHVSVVYPIILSPGD
jgi:hypothetical protein